MFLRQTVTQLTKLDGTTI